MKKMLTTLATVATLASTTLSADFVRVEMGGGVWNQTDSGYFEYQKNNVELFGLQTTGTVTATDTSVEDTFSNVYLWAYIKHPLPIVPNLRLEYAKLEGNGVLTADGSVYGLTSDLVDNGGVPTYMELTQMEAIPYYNLLDNTFWMTLDVGLSVKFIHYEASGGDTTNGVTYDESGDFPLPMLYTRARVQAPLTNFGVEAIVKYISDGGDNTASEFIVKADYTFDFIPVIQPGVEVGYRAMSIESDITDGDTRTIIDYDFSGVFAGMTLRF